MKHFTVVKNRTPKSKRTKILDKMSYYIYQAGINIYECDK